MSGKELRMSVLGLLALALVACTAAVRPTALASEEASVPRGGGGGIQVNGQVAEGLVVVGTGTASAEPEIAHILFGVELQGDDPAAIVDVAAGKIDQAIAASRALGVAEADIRTTGYNLWVETVRDPEDGTPTGEIIYHVSHYIRVKLRDLEEVGGLLAAVVESGVNAISEVSFTVEDPAALTDQARQQALEDAAARAQQMAAGLDITLGKPISVMETGGGYPALMEGIGGGGERAAVAAPSISPGTFSVSVSIQVVYEIR
jgi:uncharacterized protein YggE